MRRALRSRDQGCRFPGCTHQHTIDGHHITHWSQGGETKLTNLVQLCRFHHRLVHEGGFACTKNLEGGVEFRDPGGRRIDRAGQIPGLCPSLDITERMRDRYEDLYIDANTCVSQLHQRRHRLEYGGEWVDELMVQRDYFRSIR